MRGRARWSRRRLAVVGQPAVERGVARNLERGVNLAERLETASSLWAKFMGLMGRPPLPPGEGMWLPASNGIHMMFMRFPIDAVFVSRPDEAGIADGPVRAPWAASLDRARAADLGRGRGSGTAGRDDRRDRDRRRRPRGDPRGPVGFRVALGGLGRGASGRARRADWVSRADRADGVSDRDPRPGGSRASCDAPGHDSGRAGSRVASRAIPELASAGGPLHRLRLHVRGAPGYEPAPASRRSASVPGFVGVGHHGVAPTVATPACRRQMSTP